MTLKDFTSQWIKKVSDAGVKSFPDDFITFEKYEELKLPGKALVIGQEFFGAFEILTIDGTLIYQADNHTKAKFIVYSNRLKPQKIRIPLNDPDMKSSIIQYEKYLDQLIKEIESDYKKNFPDGKDSNNLINNIFRNLNLIRY